MARRLEARDVERLPAPERGQVDYFDKLIRGFALRVSYKGSRTFVLLYKSPVDDKRKRIKLGEYPYVRLAVHQGSEGRGVAGGIGVRDVRPGHHAAFWGVARHSLP